MRFSVNNPAWLQAAGNTENAVDYFYIQSIEDDNQIDFTSGTLSYNNRTKCLVKHNGNWIPVSEKNTYVLNSGEKILMQATSSFNTDYNTLPLFKTTKQVNIGGTVSLAVSKGDDYSFALSSLFKGITGIVSAEDVIMPKRSKKCNSMFEGCTSLISAPELPVTSLTHDECYSRMFYGCTSLVSAPELPATTLAKSCYSQMFYGCTSLVSAPELPATVMKSNCYEYMFQKTGITTAPSLQSIQLADYCYCGMFYDCSSLNSAPELPATTLKKGCYREMFGNCISLDSAPDLLATSAISECYDYMFNGASLLASVVCLVSDPVQTVGFSRWLDNTSQSGTLYKNPTSDWSTMQSLGAVPSGWTIQDYAG